MVGVGDLARDGGSDEDSERGDERDDKTVRGKLTVKSLFGASSDVADNLMFRPQAVLAKASRSASMKCTAFR